MKKQKIVITGGPGTGKSSIIRQLEKHGHECLHEISRQVTLEAQKQGIAQLFLEQPVLFSEKLLEGRKIQYREADMIPTSIIFIDRGIPDVLAYMDYFKTAYSSYFTDACKEYSYDKVFFLPPWEEIYQSDNERYESFKEASLISKHLFETYKTYGYTPIEVPKTSIIDRTQFILNQIE
ncbi:Predicted ATPase [Salegentibacter holothuriorum]|uniref:Predicted ATPase n=1 Tax=Salegentibacter holothuriorum TaxID=241145 RepID=A0A1T5AGJ0_9FLAO|nr:ATP-binding protein [Salegentibacter holothuriorum]SKB34020.1 Predicted ATPase [Salegentibacter holothuriorum]